MYITNYVMIIILIMWNTCTQHTHGVNHPPPSFPRQATQGPLAKVQLDAQQVLQGGESGATGVQMSSIETCRSLKPSLGAPPQFVSQNRIYPLEAVGWPSDWIPLAKWCFGLAVNPRISPWKGWLKPWPSPGIKNHPTPCQLHCFLAAAHHSTRATSPTVISKRSVPWNSQRAFCPKYTSSCRLAWLKKSSHCGGTWFFNRGGPNSKN